MSLIMALVCLYLSKYRAEQNKIYADKHVNNTNLIILRLFITNLLKGLTIVLLLGTWGKWINPFISFYILVPALIALNLILYGQTVWLKGFVTFVKGIYYVGLVIISLIQFLLYNTDVEILTLGFTMSLAMFECVGALFEGYSKMQEAKTTRKVNNGCVR
jgi:hypothetical protein